MSIEEKIDQAKGAAKEGVGKLIGDKKIEKEGAAEKAAAKVKEVAEDVKDAIEGTNAIPARVGPHVPNSA